MNCYYQYSNLIIVFSFIITTILEFIPWSIQFYLFKPSFYNLLIIYWVIILPNKFNIISSFFLGLFFDFVFGSTLGIHSLSYIIFTYFIINKIYFLHNISIFQQILIMIFISIINQMIIFFIEFLVNKKYFCFKIFYNCILDGILWFGLFFYLKRNNIYLYYKYNKNFIR